MGRRDLEMEVFVIILKQESSRKKRTWFELEVNEVTMRRRDGCEEWKNKRFRHVKKLSE